MKQIKYLPLILLAAFSIKFLIYKVSYEDALVMFSLTIISAMVLGTDNKKEQQELEAKIKKLEDEVNKCMKLNEDVLSNLSAIKIAGGLRNIERK